MISLEKAVLSERDWTGSMEALARKATALCEAHSLSSGVRLPKTTKALVMNYRALKILSPPQGKQFGWDHLVQLLAARHLVTQGWGREEAARRLAPYSTEYMAEHLATLHERHHDHEQIASPLTEAAESEECERATVAIRLLAAGICEQFRMARSGIPTVQDLTMSPLLAQALLLLSSAYISAGKEDIGGSVHGLLERCRKPINGNSWLLPVLSDPQFLYREITLLDPDRRIPTLDCVEMARQTQSELDLREQLAFEALRSTSEQFVGRLERAYSELRLWVTEHPVTTIQAMRTFERSEGLLLAATFLTSCYEGVQPHHLVNGNLYVCESCGTSMRRTAGAIHFLSCRVPQCKLHDKPLESFPQEWNSDTLIAKPAILAYWVGPGLDESKLYRQALAQGLEPRMYPGRDACDLSFENNTVGVDVKSFASPFILADGLNKGHGLAPFKRRIVAINDQAIARSYGYLEILRQRYVGNPPLEFMSVRELLASMEEPF